MQEAKETKLDLYEEFYQLVALLDKEKELKKFFEDVLTKRELENIHKRVLTAFLLKKGYTYEAICATLGIGMQKILNIKKALEHGSGGYHLVFERLGRITVKSKELRDYPPSPAYPLSLFWIIHHLSKPSVNRVIKK